MSAIDDIAAERSRQVTQEGWSPAHDDEHVNGEMATAAAVYALHPFHWHFVIESRSGRRLMSWRDFWPWSEAWFKPTNRRRNLVKAAALIVAEIERLDRAAGPTSESAHPGLAHAQAGGDA
jgi:hypothetical protein